MIGLTLLLACTSTPTPLPVEDSTPPEKDVEIPLAPPAPDTGVPTDVFPFDGATPTNLLAISIDTLRWDRIGRYGPDASAMPFLTEMLEQSVVLDRHHSCSNWTAPSMLCATSGLSPVDVGTFVAREATELPTVARVLRQKGYDTRLVTANGWFFAEEDALGFDTVAGGDIRAEELANQLLDQHAAVRSGTPWYLHAHFFDPHKPLCPLESYLDGIDELPSLGKYDLCHEYRKTLNAMWRDGSPEDRAAFRAHVEFRYAADLRYLDDRLRILWSELDARGALDDTLVLFFSDHGEQFMERRPIVDHPWDLFAEENRALGAFWAKNLPPRTIETRTQHEDLAATLYAVFDAVPERPIRGVPVGAAPEDRPLWLVHDHNDEYIVAVVRGHRQLTLNFDGRRFFHDLADDPLMLENRYDAQNSNVLDLWDDLNPLLDQVQSTFPAWGTPDRNP